MTQREKPDFGTYHHSTSNQSEKIRKKVSIIFMKAFEAMPFLHDDKIKILDVGCGLGFLSCLCAEYYTKSKITGVDTFEHASLKESSSKKAMKNAKILGFSERVKFQKQDVLSHDYRRSKFDLIVSNLVFHNFGKKRFEAYERLAKWSTPKSYILLGDIFFDYKTDLKKLGNLFGSVKKVPVSIGSGYKILILSEPNIQTLNF